MDITQENTKATSATLKMVHKAQVAGGGIHRNILKKQLLASGKISSKTKANPLIDGLIALGKLKIDKDYISLNPDIIQVGLLQKENDNYYIVTPNSKKHYPISKSIASGYTPGDVLDIVIDYYGQKPEITILGKSNKSFEKTTFPKKTKSTFNASQSPLENTNQLLGRVVKLSHNDLVFIPNRKNLPIRHIPILNDKEEFASFQDKICIMSLVNSEAPLLGGHIVAVKGDAGNPIHEYDAIAESYGAIMSWNNTSIQEEISKIPSMVDAESLDLISEEEANISQKGKVVDLRHLPFATIDPEDCKDMDDAIYSSFDENGNIVCYTAVANVTKYVKIGSEIGNRYTTGGFTIYAPNKAYSILPTELSTGICSLNPNEDRLAFVVKSTLDKTTGSVISSQIYDALIRSYEKYSYEDAQITTEALRPVLSKEYLLSKYQNHETLSQDEQLLMNYYASELINHGFEQRKMIRFNANNERKVIFDSDMADVIDIESQDELEYHKVIERFMITANEATAKYAQDHGLDIIYRVHDEPNQKKNTKATEFFDILEIEFVDELSAQNTNVLLDLVRGSVNEEVVNNFLIKMQSRAVYSNKLYNNPKPSTPLPFDIPQISHYALQSPHYSHTTAPIRRVVDYVSHYNILAQIHGTKPISKDTINYLIEIANQRQLDVDQAEKDFADISSVIYCEKHIGEKFTGRISKFRICSPEEGFDDRIVVIVKNKEKGFSVEIPLSQIIGNKAMDCKLSEQGCAVYDSKGNVVLSICKPLDFTIEKADRKTMNIVGRTNKTLSQAPAEREAEYKKHKYFSSNNGFLNQKKKRVTRFETKKSHSQHQRDDAKYRDKDE